MRFVSFFLYTWAKKWASTCKTGARCGWGSSESHWGSRSHTLLRGCFLAVCVSVCVTVVEWFTATDVGRKRVMMKSLIFLFYFYLCVGDVFRTWQRRARVTVHGIYIYGKKRTTIRNKCSGSRCHSLLSSVSAETWGNRNDYIMCMAKNCSQKSTFRVPINFVRRSFVSRRAPNAHHTRKLCGIQYASHFCWSGILLINVLSLGAGLQYTD